MRSNRTATHNHGDIIATPAQELQFDIVSDVVCPRCVIGHQQLATSLAESGVAHEIHRRPFELNPAMPSQGQSLRGHVSEKYGATSE